MKLRRLGGATAAVTFTLLTAPLGCPNRDTAGGAPSATASSTAPASTAGETEWTAVRVDPKTYQETTLGVIAFSDKPPFNARFVSGDEAMKKIVDETNARDHVMSTGLSGPGTRVARDEEQYFRIMRGNWLEKVHGILLEVRPKTLAPARRFRAFYSKNGKSVELGVVAMKPSHYLQIIESKEGEAEHLFKALNEVDRSDGFSVDIPPPEGAREGKYGRGVERGTPLFFALMRDKLLHRANVVLSDEARSRPAELHHEVRTGAGLAQLHWLEVDIDKTLSPADKLAPGEQLRYEAPAARLALIVEKYGAEYTPAALGQIVSNRFGSLPDFKAGPLERVPVAGRELLTAAFRTGTGDSATDHAVVFWPRTYFTAKSEEHGNSGVLIHVTAPARGESPDAQTALGHEVIARSMDSLYIDTEWAY
jgi:hypothetical protein